ncbi:MAG: hypothetical protein ACR2KQ_08440 [Actinomycetota bacterium]
MAVLAGPEALAYNQDASEQPRSSGPLIASPGPCVRDEASGKGGTTTFESCYWSYSLIPAESDIDEDFSALWYQLEIDPGKGTCATGIGIEISAPSDGRIVSSFPDRSRRIRKSSARISMLTIDGEGSAPLPGTIEQDVVDVPGRVKAKVSSERYRFEWRGKSRKKVMFAVGVEMAHSSLPPAVISMQSVSEWYEAGNCDAQGG